VVGHGVPKAVRRGGAYKPHEKIELSSNGTALHSDTTPHECQNCGNIQWFATTQFRFMHDCHECGGGRFFEFDFELARSLSPETERSESE